eukprot:2056715-Pleurochrysis_carterae.AAC.9
MPKRLPPFQFRQSSAQRERVVGLVVRRRDCLRRELPLDRGAAADGLGARARATRRPHCLVQDGRA